MKMDKQLEGQSGYDLQANLRIDGDSPSAENVTEYLCFESFQNGDPRSKMNIWLQMRN